MSTTQVTPAEHHQALRGALVAHVAAHSPRRRTARRWALTGGALALGLGGATAAAAGLGVLPGADRVTALADPVHVTAQGSRVVELGTAPADATHVDAEIRCLTAGRFTFADGAGGACAAGEEIGYSLPIEGSSTRIDADSLRWEGTFTYARHDVTPLGVNADGDTFGIEAPGRPVPDLVAVVATNGAEGYAYARDLAPTHEPTSPADALAWQEEHGDDVRRIPVYLSDGRTEVGEFVITAG